MMSVFSLFGSNTFNDNVVEPYNATLSVHQLVENADLVSMFDNRALSSICVENLKINQPTYGDMNQIVV